VTPCGFFKEHVRTRFFQVLAKENKFGNCFKKWEKTRFFTESMHSIYFALKIKKKKDFFLNKLIIMLIRTYDYSDDNPPLYPVGCPTLDILLKIVNHNPIFGSKTALQ
jgi:hypothetical protein